MNKNYKNYSALNSLNDVMIKIPSGEIQLRDDRKKSVWSVKVNQFSLCKYPVTQELYSEVIKESPFSFEGSKNPAETVSWNDTIQFCNKLSMISDLKECYTIIGSEEVELNKEADGYRLPTDAEWEYACRGATGKVRYGEIDKIAWYKENSENRPHEVGKKEPNDWGLYDMLGNVWEWCWDIYDKEVYGPYRIFRGGGWYDSERGCFASNRRRSHPTYKIDDLGFRLARSL